MANHINVKAIVTVQLTITGLFKNIGLSQGFDGFSDLLLGDAFELELVRSYPNSNHELETTLGKEPVKGNAKLNITKKDGNEVKYEANLQVHENFGEIGAILITNEHHKETYLKDIVLDGLPQGVVKIYCESWIHSKYDNPEKRVFFVRKPCLPSETPAGLKALREKELENLRGNGDGERKSFDRIYDYAPYNDLGDPDSKPELSRPVLGGKDHPYPRRCRTGRLPTKADPLSESRTSSFYVPRDENFADVKEITFGISVLDNVLNALIPSLEGLLENSNQGFLSFKDIQDLYTTGISLPDMKDPDEMHTVCPDLFQTKGILRFPAPDLIERDEFAWFRDEEFARETLAGLNPYSIKLIKDWPIVSKLDPKTYGPQESAITSPLVEQQINGIMSANEAVEEKKLFMLDYHDLFLPYVNKVRKIQGTTLYGSRTVFFLTDQGTLRPLAIELVRPPTDDGKPQWKQVYTPSGDDATHTWLWRLAKAHVLAHDSGYHELISHWYACIFIITIFLILVIIIIMHVTHSSIP